MCRVQCGVLEFNAKSITIKFFPYGSLGHNRLSFQLYKYFSEVELLCGWREFASKSDWQTWMLANCDYKVIKRESWKARKSNQVEPDESWSPQNVHTNAWENGVRSRFRASSHLSVLYPVTAWSEGAWAYPSMPQEHQKTTSVRFRATCVLHVCLMCA